MAYAIARAAPRRRPLLLMLVILPFWTSFLIRVYAWIGPSGRERHPQPVPALDRPRVRSRHDPGHRMGGASRHRLRLPALHGAAALRRAGEARHEPARGGGRSRRQAVRRLPHHHPAAVAARHRRRLPAGVHPGGRRVRDPRPSGRHRHADDRQGAVGRVLHQCRLAARLGGGDLPAGAAGRADRPLPAPAGAEAWSAADGQAAPASPSPCWPSATPSSTCRSRW